MREGGGKNECVKTCSRWTVVLFRVQLLTILGTVGFPNTDLLILTTGKMTHESYLKTVKVCKGSYACHKDNFFIWLCVHPIKLKE